MSGKWIWCMSAATYVLNAWNEEGCQWHFVASQSWIYRPCLLCRLSWGGEAGASSLIWGPAVWPLTVTSSRCGVPVQTCWNMFKHIWAVWTPEAGVVCPSFLNFWHLAGNKYSDRPAAVGICQKVVEVSKVIKSRKRCENYT